MKILIQTKFNSGFLFFLLTALVAVAVVAALFAKIFPLLTAKTLYFCQQFFSKTLFPIPQAFSNTLIMALGLTLLIGVASFLIQLYKTQILWRRFTPQVIALPQRLQKIAAALHLEKRVQVVNDANLFSFCVGLIFPRIIFSRKLVSILSNKELEAVLLHEQAHIKNYDPLKMVFGKTIASTFFFLPIFAELNKNMMTSSELLADNWTIQIQKTAVFLKGAIKKILAAPKAALAETPAISHPNSLEARIYQLANPKSKPNFCLSLVSIVTTILFLVFSFFVWRTSVEAFHLESSSQASYFFCLADNSCREQCRFNAQRSPIISPEDLFWPTPKYQAPSYK